MKLMVTRIAITILINHSLLNSTTAELQYSQSAKCAMENLANHCTFNETKQKRSHKINFLTISQYSTL